MKGNEQKAEYEEPGRKTRETRSERTGKTQEAKAEREHRGSHCEARAGRERKGRNRGQVARTGREADERKQIEREKPESESVREALEEQLRERIKEGRKETISKAKYKNLEGRHEKSGWRERGNRGSESGDGHRESNCEAELGRKRKGRNRGQVARTGREADER